MVVGTARLIHLVGGRPDSVEGIHTYTALEAASGLLTEETLHLDLLDQVLSALVNVAEAIDRLARDVGGSGHQVFVLLLLSQLIGHR